MNIEDEITLAFFRKYMGADKILSIRDMTPAESQEWGRLERLAQLKALAKAPVPKQDNLSLLFSNDTKK